MNQSYRKFNRSVSKARSFMNSSAVSSASLSLGKRVPSSSALVKKRSSHFASHKSSCRERGVSSSGDVAFGDHVGASGGPDLGHGHAYEEDREYLVIQVMDTGAGISVVSYISPLNG